MSQSEDAFEYEVERILRKKVDRLGRITYLVKWLGFPDNENSWEPLENLSNAMGKVEQYEAAIRKLKKARKKKAEPPPLPPSKPTDEPEPEYIVISDSDQVEK